MLSMDPSLREDDVGGGYITRLKVRRTSSRSPKS